MDSIINVKVRGNHLSKDNRNAGVQYEANVTHLRIDFDEGWDGYAKSVTFWNALMGNPTKITLTTDKLEDILVSPRTYLIPIPGEAMTEAGYPTFVIDGFVDGKRKRSLADTLWVKEAPYDEDAGEPADPTPSQAEQLQVQVDQIMGTIQNAAQSAADALSYAEYSRGQADNATSAAQYAQEMADYSYNVKEEAVTAKNAAQAAQGAIEGMTATVETLAAGASASVQKTVNNGVVNLHLGIPKGEKGDRGERGERGERGPAGDGTGDMLAVVYDSQGRMVDVFKFAEDLFAQVERAKTGGEIDQRLQNRIEKTGDKMTGILEFDTPGLFSAIQKKRTISNTNYMMRVGIGSYGTGGTLSLRLVTVGADGAETGAGQFDIDASGLVWVTPGGLRKTVAHSGNLGVLTAALE